MSDTTVIDVIVQVSDETGSGARSAEANVSKLERSIMNLQKQIMGMKGKSKLEVVASLKDMASKGIQSVASAGKNIAGKIWTVTMKAKDLVTAPFKKVLGLISSPVTQVAAFAGISLGVADTLDTFKDFEAAMSQVQAVSGATGSDLEKLTAKAKEMGASTKFTAAESAEAMNYMAMAGWKTKDMLGGIEGIMNLAAASGESLGTTSDIVTDALTAFNMKASDAGHFSDVLAAASSNANTNVSMMGETFKYAGSMAGSLGYSIEDVALATGLMANSGIKASMGGTALNSIMTRLATDAGASSKKLGALGTLTKKLGVEFYDAHGNARDLSKVMEEMRKATKGMTDEEKSNIAKTIAGTEAQKGLLAILNASEKDYKKLSKAINNSDGAAKGMADTMQDNLSGSITYLQSAVDGVKISLGEKLAPRVKGIVDWLTGQMPAVEKALGSFLDMALDKVDGIKDKFAQISSSDEFKNADLFGKVKIAWDKIIAEPFSVWWKINGKAKLADAASGVGTGIGNGIKTGILALLGIDIPDAAEEGASIGGSFIKGFAEGLDFSGISKKLMEGLGKLIKNAGKLLPGGDSAGLSSVLSAGILAKIISPFVKAGAGGVRIGRSLFGERTTPQENGEPQVVPGIGRLILGNAAAGTGLLGFGANTAIKLGAGNLAGGASLSAGALSALGLGGIAGGAVGAGSAVSGMIDLYKSLKSDSSEKSTAYKKSAAWKIGGVGAGAAAGAALGSIVPGLGTAVGGLIGAGIGGIAGIVGGNKVKSDYKENLKATQIEAEKTALKAQKALETTGRSIKNVRFETSSLNSAINDSEVSVEQFGNMFQNAVGEKLKNNFGNLKLSLSEIQNAAKKIVFDNNEKQIEKFANATQKSVASMETLKSRVQEIDRLNWETKLGVKLSKESKKEYKNSMKSLADEAQSYLSDKHYEADIAINMLVGKDKGKGIKKGLNGAYEGLESQINEASTELQRVVSTALSDGVISTKDKVKVNIGGVKYKMDEASAVAELQNQIAGITNKVTTVQQDAKLEALKIRFSGAALDADSFAALQEEMQLDVASFSDNYNQALELGIANVKMSLQEGAIDQSEYDKQISKLTEGYEANIQDLQMRVESFQLDTIAESFGSSLDGILPDIEGTTSEKLSTAMANALAINPEPLEWSQEQIASWFGLEGLGAETQAAVSGLLQQTAESIDYSASGSAVASGVGNAIQNADMEPVNSAVSDIKSKTDSMVNSVFGEGVSTKMPVNVTADYKLMNPNATVNVTGGGSGTAALTANISAHAKGGIMTRPHIGLVAEDGAEAIIPLSGKQKEHSLSLWEKAGQMLGVRTYAEGGIVGDAKPEDIAGTTEPVPVPVAEPAEGNGGGNIPVTIQSLNFEINVNSSEVQNAQALVDTIRENVRGMTDEIAYQLATAIQQVYANTPKESWGL